ncbi:MAG: metallophosphoesterase family protein [Rhodothermales bacterium]|nr:metallophosphoesterase family protein [Rhodothermales bacterium]
MSIDTRDREKITARTRPAPAGYDYRLQITDAAGGGDGRDRSAISFLAVGDSGSKGRSHRPKYLVANNMVKEGPVDLVLHLGDVVYSSGSKEGYEDRFIRAYRYWLKDGAEHRYDDLVFTTPFLPVYGNHDYYDFHKAVPLIGDLVGRVLGEVVDEVGSGSGNGRVFEEAFVARDLAGVRDGVLPYVPGRATRIPNRYYWFTHGPCAFFALDSNTLDGTGPPSDQERPELELKLREARSLADVRRLQYERLHRHIEAGGVRADVEGIALEQVRTTLYEVVIGLAEAEKEAAMLEKQLSATREDFDRDQLAWLRRVLQHADAEGKWKVVYMHHPLYSSDGSHTDDPESVGLRHNLRRVLVEHGVHLVLSGHSHCFEWVAPKAPDGAPAGPSEQNICYLVSGGGGRGLRRSILEDDPTNVDVLKKRGEFLRVAESHAYTALLGENDAEAVYHFLRVDATEDALRVTPVGVLDRGSVTGERERERDEKGGMRTKVLRAAGGTVEAEACRIGHVDVFRDKPPEGRFEPV